MEIINDEMIRMIFVDDLVDLIDDRLECNAVDCTVYSDRQQMKKKY